MRITTITNYPDDGNHQQLNTDLPFCIRKGEDAYMYTVRGVDHQYKQGSKRWIAHLERSANPSLYKIFEVKCHRNMDVVYQYCVKMYKKSLEMEIERLKEELKLYQ